MASNAALLLDPRAYKKRLEERGQQNINRLSHDSASSATPAAAHLLLNPRSYPPSSQTSNKSWSQSGSRSPMANTAPPQPNAKPFSDLDVEFFSTCIDGDNGGKRGFEQLDNDAAKANHGRLIEDIYGVEGRERHPYKRIKMDGTLAENPKSTKKTAYSSSGDSGLGKWMKEGHGKLNTLSSTKLDIVDLTSSKDDTHGSSNDDDDLQVTGFNDLSNQKVCYGKLENAMVQAFMVPKPGANIFGDSMHDWPSLKLGVRRQPGPGSKIDLSDPHGKVFGAVDAKTASVLAPLLDSPALRVEITARLDVRKRLPGEQPWANCSAFYRASINLYGLRKDAELVGKHLGHHNVWLGTPHAVEQGTSVFNPHAELRRAQKSFSPASNSHSRQSVSYEVRTAEEVNDAVMKMFDQLQSADNIPEMEPSPLLSTPLLRHQKQALWFMTEKEKPRKFGPSERENNSLWRVESLRNGKKRFREIISGTILDYEPPQTLGGLLADMMGLGKTLSILSLVVAFLRESYEWANMIPHPELVRNSPGIRNTKTTLLVVPLSAVNNWVMQIKEHLKENAISYYVFHGPSRTADVDELSKYDLVITTYSIVLSELSGRGSKRGVSPLTKMNMFRIVLDEAHTIREQSAAQTQAILKLNANRRWAVTGTPIQNRLEDLYSITKFLGLFPYDDRTRFGMHILSRFKSGDPGVLASLRVLVDSFTLRRVKDKINLPPRHDKIISLTFSEKEKQLHEFFRNESNAMMSVIAGDSRKKIGGRMYHHVLKAMMILRQVCAHGKELLDKEDRDRAKGMSVQDAIDLDDGEETQKPSDVVDKKAYEMFTLMQDSSADSCALCAKRLEEQYTDADVVDKKAILAIVLPCFDVLCPDCFSGWKQAFDTTQNGASSHEIKCQACDGWIPVAYTTITSAGLQEYQINQARAKQSRRQAKTLGEYEGPHTKTNALTSHLLASAAESKKLKDERPIKSVVFSSWTSHLDLIEIALKDNGLTGYTRLDGTMTLSARKKALDTFRDDDGITILLATIGAGGVGLNLTSASNVYIMEPQYNPAAVAQAVDRVHRLGQTREVTTVQFIMKGSIEEKILELARKKQQLADMSMNRGKLGKKEIQEQRMREYRSLFK
ncbi:hypothetical protein MAP00_005971 [Monascus purpureus]|nr:hypothetical protein MAP00_005971 [Monascus purpureus]